MGTEEYSRSLSLHVRFLHPPGRGLKRRPSRGDTDEVKFDVGLGPAAVEIQKARAEVRPEIVRGENLQREPDTAQEGSPREGDIPRGIVG